MDKLIQERILRYVARRDHSIKELAQKLRRFHSPHDIETALTWVQTQSWMPPESQISERVARRLHEKHRGIHAINHYLQSKGLPPQSSSQEQESEKAQALVTKKFAALSAWSPKTMAKAMRFLTSRGFSSDIIQKTLAPYKKRMVHADPTQEIYENT